MQYPTLTRAVYLQYESLLDRNAAAILALVLVALAAVVVWLESRVARRRGATYRSSPGAGRRAQTSASGAGAGRPRSSAPRASGVFLALPFGVLVWWAPRASTGSPFRLAWRRRLTRRSHPQWRLVAQGSRPSRSRCSRGGTRHAGPAYSNGLRTCRTPFPGSPSRSALVYFGARYGGVLYQSLALLIFAYVVRFLPQALAATRSSLELVDPRVEEASRSLGRGPTRTLLAVVVPLARPGILAGAALVFLSAMKELPATLLLRPIGFDTLATEIWTDTSIGAYGDAAPAGSAPDRGLRAACLRALGATRLGARRARVSIDPWPDTASTSTWRRSTSSRFRSASTGPIPNSSSAIASSVAEMLGVSRASAGEMLKRLEAEGLVERGEHKEAILTETGIERAERVVRKHRIIERLLTDFMGYTPGEAHIHADELGDTFTRRHGRADRGAARQPRPLPARLAGRPGVRAGARTRSWRRSPTSKSAARRRSSGSPSTTASSCTGSTTRASRPGRRSSSARRSRRRASSRCCSAATRAGDRREGRSRPLRPPDARRAAPPAASRSGARSPRS